MGERKGMGEEEGEGRGKDGQTEAAREEERKKMRRSNDLMIRN